ncbi:hypothetical protein EI77_04550 [Prosthecobacter fusiformis]|uniref:ATPase family protein associated with various cellular activities (AAA) n=1 Tax=Prosthecobacter fusiformis TaxID=48464 RepID=A0A4R7RIM0_9BACT|nr:hypothetical protein [Prosthecobacter fusiformis]TDU63029.1 hypothetical protein EI77_04550 [Prosthecobacter fusiformis]
MPRPGGESGKLGDRYEAIWTVDSILDVLCGEALSIVVEPFDATESLGIEFKKELPECTEFHSAKRQTTGQLWSIADLIRIDTNGRSVLGDLFSKLDLDENHRVVFVSGTTARDLEEICGAAIEAQDSAAFETRLDTVSRRMHREVDERLLRPHFKGDISDAWHTLRRVRVVSLDEREMIRRVDQRIRAMLYRPDGSSLDATAVRCLVAEMVFGLFGQPIRRHQIIDYLNEHNVAERDWAREHGPREIVERLNTAYMGHVEAELIAGERIAREEAKTAVDALVGGGKKRVVFIGAAGLGKSCAVAQTLVHLHGEHIPVLALRLDIQTAVLTSRRFGEELGLPESPVLVLAGIANGGRCVLVLDQLDAISFTSGRNQSLWNVFEEMLIEAQHYPQMRVLLACRAFDAEHDPRLRRLLADKDNAVQIDLGKLPFETVKRLVQEHAGVDPATLDVTHLDLLRAPLHLSLYLQGDPQSHPRFSGVQELLGRYWSHKRRLVGNQLGRGSRWHDIILSLVGRLSRDQTLSASVTLLDPYDETEIGLMASHNVIVLDGVSVRFFHEVFFDYCCARLFMEQGQTLLDFLTEGGLEQHLFRRAQVRQILEYEREHNVEAYLRDLRELLANSRVRYHLKKLALDWLGGLADPREEEWRLLESLDSAAPITRWALRISWGRPAWVYLLGRIGVWERWLESAEVETVWSAVRMLSLPEIMKVYSAEIARLFRPYVDGTKTWRAEFNELFSFGEFHHSAEMFSLICDAMRLHLLRVPNSDDWYRYEKLAQEKPDFAVQLLALMLDLECESNGDEVVGNINDKTNFITECARRAPEPFVRAILPRVIEHLKKHDSDAPWRRSYHRRMISGADAPEEALEQGLELALESLAQDHPYVLDALTEVAEEFQNETISILLLSAWVENGSHYADKIVCYLLQNPERLGLGYHMWQAGNGRAAIGRSAVRKASIHCSATNYAMLETAILVFTTEYERQKPGHQGYRRMLLLECLPSERISNEARLHFEELKRKFPWEKFEMPGTSCSFGFIGSPIKPEAVERMNNAQWIKAMQRYACERKRDSSDFLKGGKSQLASILQEQAQIDKPRFAELALRLDVNIAPEYFNSILSGISSIRPESSRGTKLPASALESLNTIVAEQVIARAHSLYSHECARDICWAIKAIAENHPSNAIVAILCHYAMNDPDPETEQWQEMAGGSAMWGGDPHFHGMNSVRGVAAEALAILLFADQIYFGKIKPAVLSVVHDRSIAVRSCAILCLVAMINFDRERAVALFLELCKNATPVLNTHYSEQFIYHATYRHYLLLRPVLVQMLTVKEEGTRAIAGRQITLAAFHDSHAASDMQSVLGGDNVCREAAAKIYAHNLGREALQSICRERLAQLFDDPDAKVRGTAANCFRLLSPALLAQEQNLIYQFIESIAFVENSHELIHALEKSTEALPEVICRIPERLIAEYRAEQQSGQTRRWIYHLPALIARLYEQARDAQIKSRCLDIIDGMLELGFSEIEKELAQVER